MKKNILKVIRWFIYRLIGVDKIEKTILILCRLAMIDPLTFAYQNIGISKYGNHQETGEFFLIAKILTKYLKNAESTINILDIGANTGSYCMHINSEFPEANIYAFEPNNNAYRILLKNMANYNNIRCYNLGLSSTSDKQKIYTYESDLISEHASVYSSILLDLHEANKIIELEFEATTVDKFCEDNEINYINFMKIDTEGHELEVIKGAKRMIDENKIGIVQFEFNEMNVFSRVFLKDFYVLLREYKFYRLNSQSLIPLFEYRPMNEIFQYQNIIAIQKNYIKEK